MISKLSLTKINKLQSHWASFDDYSFGHTIAPLPFPWGLIKILGHITSGTSNVKKDNFTIAV